VVVLADLAESAYALDIEQIEAARERARQLLEAGVPEAENREAALALRRAELGLRLHRKLQGQRAVMRIIEDDNGE
jgi:F0F1-type ATP synthase epsilon subunit